ncbi:hypothetical protein [Paracraurococcus ruber]|uniref:Uncharacterized protein n=1 Tax=Paracraurococcus ruber TaxID=77675 RepID=A0ABS1CRF2_9PROT|nr:hypothetical protein [Paracraurococcus ruber]MBK1656866.1 hypothetical protein [Paracraurococcus ruber]TDG33980.1 hypothetical protein E2C05_01695 [Paracraurococcus ruber]
MSPAIRAAIAWLPEEDFATFRAAQVDADRLPATWDQWRQRFERQLKQQGISLETCIRVHVQLDDLRAFCAARGLVMDSRGRSAFAAFKAASGQGLQ